MTAALSLVAPFANGACQLRIEIAQRSLADYCLELGDDVASPDEQWDAGLDRGDRDHLSFRESIAAVRHQTRNRSGRGRAG